MRQMPGDGEYSPFEQQEARLTAHSPDISGNMKASECPSLVL
jgi:hypothetical protein